MIVNFKFQNSVIESLLLDIFLENLSFTNLVTISHLVLYGDHQGEEILVPELLQELLRWLRRLLVESLRQLACVQATSKGNQYELILTSSQCP